jgi:hypothetical protein
MAERTKVRSEAIMAGFRAHFQQVGQELGNIKLSTGLGPLKIDVATPGIIKAEFEGYSRALDSLNSSLACLDGRTFDNEPILRLELKVPNVVELRTKMLDKAEASYGRMAGITATLTYDQQQDPYLAALHKV